MKAEEPDCPDQASPGEDDREFTSPCHAKNDGGGESHYGGRCEGNDLGKKQIDQFDPALSSFLGGGDLRSSHKSTVSFCSQGKPMA
jgi:hypothetical protein